MAYGIIKTAKYLPYGVKPKVKAPKTFDPNGKFSGIKPKPVKNVKVGPVDTISKLASIYRDNGEVGNIITDTKMRKRIKGYKDRLSVSRALRKAGDGRRGSKMKKIAESMTPPQPSAPAQSQMQKSPSEHRRDLTAANVNKRSGRPARPSRS